MITMNFLPERNWKDPPDGVVTWFNLKGLNSGKAGPTGCTTGYCL
jgi:hypothetical protein